MHARKYVHTGFSQRVSKQASGQAGRQAGRRTCAREVCMYHNYFFCVINNLAKERKKFSMLEIILNGEMRERGMYVGGEERSLAWGKLVQQKGNL